MEQGFTLVSKEGEGVEFLIEFTRLYNSNSEGEVIYLQKRKQG